MYQQVLWEFQILPIPIVAIAHVAIAHRWNYGVSSHHMASHIGLDVSIQNDDDVKNEKNGIWLIAENN